MRVVIFIALFVCVLNSISCQTCDQIVDTTIPCQCTIDDAFTTFQYVDKCETPSNMVPTDIIYIDGNTPTTVVIDKNNQNKPIKLKGNSVTVFTGLLTGLIYEFSTSSRIGAQYSAQFDTVIVVRDIDGNVLAANDNCEIHSMTDKASYVAYTHTSDNAKKFNTVYVSVYVVTKEFSCYTTISSSPNSLYTYLYYGVANLDSSLSGTEYFECIDTYVYFNRKTSLDKLLDYYLISPNSPITLFEFSRDGENFESWPESDDYIFECDMAGDISVWFRLYGKTVECPYYLTSYNTKRAPVDGSGLLFTCEDEYALVTPEVVPDCQYYPWHACTFDPKLFIPIIELQCSTNKSALEYKLADFDLELYYDYTEIFSPDSFDARTEPSWGDAVKYTIEGYSGWNGENLGTTSCTRKFIGSQIISVASNYLYDDYYVENGGFFYYDVDYFIYFTSTVDYFFQISAQPALYIRGSPKDSESSYYFLDGSRFSIGEGFYYFEIDPITPDDVPPGVYELVLYNTFYSNYLGSIDPDAIYVNPAKYSFSARGIGQYSLITLHSIGNPIVQVTAAPPNTVEPDEGPWK